MPSTNEPRFATYEVFHRHTGVVISTHPTRGEAETMASKDHAHRVRGSRPIEKPSRSRMGDVLRSLRGLR